jgi:cytochrome c
LNIDPNFKTNKLIYMYYSPPSSEKDTAQHLSRFKYDDVKDTLMLGTEEVLLTVPVKEPTAATPAVLLHGIKG